MRNRLARLEARLQSIVEGSAARIFPLRPAQNDLAYRLVEAMRAGLQYSTADLPDRSAGSPDSDKRTPTAPNLYTLVVHPQRAQALQAENGLLNELARALREAGEDAGFRFPSPPVVRILADESLGLTELQVLAQNSRADLSQTRDFVVEGPQRPALEMDVPAGAFLIVDGGKAVPLNQPVVNIGRRLDNHIVLNDNRVSRVHAQLRLVRGRYVIFDLDSTGGTLVNGAPVRQAQLRPGDVITLSGVPLVYGQDEGGPDETQEVDLEPPGESR